MPVAVYSQNQPEIAEDPRGSHPPCLNQGSTGGEKPPAGPGGSPAFPRCVASGWPRHISDSLGFLVSKIGLRFSVRPTAIGKIRVNEHDLVS